MNTIKRAVYIYKERGTKALLKGIRRYIQTKTPDIIPLVKQRIIRWSEGEETIQAINGSKMLLKTGESGIDRDLLLSGTREQASTVFFERALREFLSSTELPVYIFDVGSNIGYFALLECKLSREKDRIFAIEPEPENVSRLLQNLNLNNYENIEVIESAVGREAGLAMLEVKSDSNLHQISENVNENSAMIEVDVITLDELAKEKSIPNDFPVVIRIDVEGYEMNVFYGMKDIIKSDRPLLLFMEIHSNVGSAEEDYMFEYLSKNGLNIEYVSYDGGQTGYTNVEYSDAKKDYSNKHVIFSRQ